MLIVVPLFTKFQFWAKTGTIKSKKWPGLQNAKNRDYNKNAWPIIKIASQHRHGDWHPSLSLSFAAAIPSRLGDKSSRRGQQIGTGTFALLLHVLHLPA